MNVLRVSLCCAFGLVAACGGPEKPPQSASGSPDPALPTSAPSATTPPPTSDSPDVAKGFDAFEKGDMAAAQASFEAALKNNPKDVVALHKLGEVHERSGHKQLAEENYREALKVRPDFVDSAVRLSALLLDDGKVEDAAALCRDSLKKHPESAGLHANFALALAAKSDTEGAAREFDDALKKTPDDIKIHYTYGHWLGVWTQKDPSLKERALEHLRYAMRSTDVDMLASVGHELLVLREPSDCVKAFDKAVSAKDGADLRLQRGLCKMALKDEAGATGDFRDAIKLDAKYPLPHYWLAIRLSAAGKLKEAIGEFETYVKLDPSGPKAKDADEKIKILKKQKK